MEIAATSLAAGMHGQAPDPAVQDLRPSADAAASTRDATPELPLPIPPTAMLQGAVSRSLTAPDEAGRARPDAPVKEAERTLKPYGVTMLPHHEDETGDTR